MTYIIHNISSSIDQDIVNRCTNRTNGSIKKQVRIRTETTRKFDTAKASANPTSEISKFARYVAVKQVPSDSLCIAVKPSAVFCLKCWTLPHYFLIQGTTTWGMHWTTRQHDREGFHTRTACRILVLPKKHHPRYVPTCIWQLTVSNVRLVYV